MVGAFIHGGTDAEPRPRYDFSSNANALGPNPYVLENIYKADLAHYPDPNYTELYRALAASHSVEEDRIAVGAGSSELIHRLVRWKATKSVLVLKPTFSEYARAAQIAGVEVWEVEGAEDYLSCLARASLAFLCIPNNPTGEVYDFLQQAALMAKEHGVVLVCDLAYLPLLQVSLELPSSLWKLYSPNKANGLTGIRGGYLIAPETIRDFRHQAPSWIVSAYAEAFLTSSLRPEAQAWIGTSIPMLWQWRDQLAQSLQALGLEVRVGQANFLLVKVNQASNITQSLRHKQIAVRDCTSFGMPQFMRLSAQKPEAQTVLVDELKNMI